MSFPLLATVDMEHVMALASVLFVLGAVGVLVRRNLIFVLMSVEIMLNAGAVAFIAAAGRWHQADGQVMFFFILSVAAAEAAVGLAMLLNLYRQKQTLDADAASEMSG
jgi:NADH-quinone oxidoreductase subunit K